MHHSRWNLVLLVLLTGASTAKSDRCDCYATNGSSSAYFQYHQFSDFRSIPNPGGLYDKEPANLTDSQDKGDEPAQKGFLSSDAFNRTWSLSAWGRRAGGDHKVRMENSKQNVYIKSDKTGGTTSTYLSLRARRNREFTSAAEIVSQQKNLYHASIRIHARAFGSAGAVIGMFTYLNDSTESDIEIMTRGPPNRISCTNQPSLTPDGETIPEASTNATLPDPVVWTDWNTYRLDWLPDRSTWYVNDVEMVTKTYGVPKRPSSFLMNVWSDGSEWSGNMTVGSAAYLQVQWVEMVFNVSGSADGSTSKSSRDVSKPCSKVCNVDEAKQKDDPKTISRATSTFDLKWFAMMYGICWVVAGFLVV